MESFQLQTYSLTTKSPCSSRPVLIETSYIFAILFCFLIQKLKKEQRIILHLICVMRLPPQYTTPALRWCKKNTSAARTCQTPQLEPSFRDSSGSSNRKRFPSAARLQTLRFSWAEVSFALVSPRRSWIASVPTRERDPPRGGISKQDTNFSCCYARIKVTL